MRRWTALILISFMLAFGWFAGSSPRFNPYSECPPGQVLRTGSIDPGPNSKMASVTYGYCLPPDSFFLFGPPS
jgi:hypothetical protein